MSQPMLSERDKLTVYLNQLHESVRKVREMCQMLCDAQEAEITRIQAVLDALPAIDVPPPELRH